MGSQEQWPGGMPWRGIITEFRDRLPLAADAPVITLSEGGTPLVHSAWLSGLTGGDVHLKVEGSNPTGSFKDRGMTVAISHAAGEGAKAVVCASTGNTSASMAAYAARAGLTPIVLVPHGRIAAGKMAQAVMFGAEIIQIRGGFDECLQMARELADEYPVSLVNSVNPMRLQGQKTASFEIIAQLGKAPDLHVMPVGNAGNIAAYWMGFGESGAAPRMWGFQAAGAAPLVARSSDCQSGDRRQRHPHRQPGIVGPRHRGAGRIGWTHRRGDRRADPRRTACGRSARRHLRGAGIGCRRGWLGGMLPRPARSIPA